MYYGSSDYYLSDSLPMLLMIIGFVIVLFAQYKVTSTFNKYKKKKNTTNIDGLDAAKKILEANNMDLYVVKTPGELTDHYDPRGKVVRLSDSVYTNSSIGSVAVAAHECGHALQDKEGYFFFKLRSLLVPVVNLVNRIGYIAMIISLLAGALNYLVVGIIMVLATILFQVVTLPVEFDASKRGLEQIKKLGLLDPEEYKGAKDVLSAAALTYVAGTISSLLQLLRLVLILNRRRN